MEIKTKFVDNVKEAYEQVNGKVIDLDLAVELLMNFNSKVLPQAKKFKSMASKFDGKNPKGQEKKAKKFAIEQLFPTFEKEFLKKFYFNDEYKILEKDIIAIYILGCFIEGHSTTTKIDVDKQFKLLTVELTNNIYQALVLAHQENLNK